MAHLIFREAFSLSGRYFPAGSSHDFTEQEAAAVPEWVAVEADTQLIEGGSVKHAASEKSTKTASTKI